MGCNFCNEPSACTGTQATLPQNCQCADPGLISTGANVIVSDTYNCPRRLQPLRDGSNNVINGFVYVEGASQTPTVFVTNQPKVAYPTLAPLADASFGSLVLSSGVLGVHYRLTPPSTADLVLQTDAIGGLKFAAIPAATVPDPLTVDNLTVAVAATIEDLTVTTNINSDLPGGTIVSLVGLDSGNNFVQGSVAIIKKAFYFESGTRTGTGYPNATLTSGQNCTIGNPIYNADNITHVGAVDTIVIDETGHYQIEWSGIFGRVSTSGGRTLCPGLALFINGSIVNPGMRDPAAIPSATQKLVAGVPVTVTGVHVQALNATNTIRLVVQDSVAASNLRDVQLIITKFKSS